MSKFKTVGKFTNSMARTEKQVYNLMAEGKNFEQHIMELVRNVKLQAHSAQIMEVGLMSKNR